MASFSPEEYKAALRQAATPAQRETILRQIARDRALSTAEVVQLKNYATRLGAKK